MLLDVLKYPREKLKGRSLLKNHLKIKIRALHRDKLLFMLFT